MTTLTKKDEAESVGPSGAPAAHSSDVTETLKVAREKIRTAWVNHYPTGSGEHCAVTAIPFIAGSGAAAYRLVCRAAGTEEGYLGHWSDTPGRTKEEVLAAFDRAIALSEGNAAEPPKEAISESPHGK